MLGKTKKTLSPKWRQDEKELDPAWTQKETGQNTTWRQREIIQKYFSTAWRQKRKVK